MTTEIEGINVPRAVASQSEAADEFYRKQAEAAETGDGGAPADPEAEATPQTGEPEEPESTDTPPEAPAEPAEEPAEAGPEKTPETEPEKSAKEADFEQKYKTLKGKYDAEVPRLWGQLKAAQDKLAQSEKKIADLEAQQKQAPADTPAPDGDYNPEDFEDYGPEFVKLAKANQQLQQTVADLKGKLDQVSSDVSTTKQNTSEQDFYKTIADKVTGWEQQNNDPEFLGWLQNREPITGHTYHQLLADAERNFDGQRAAQIFLRFREENNGKQYAPQPTQTGPEPKPDTQQQKIPQPTVAPPKSRGGGEPNPASQGRIISRDEVTKLYKDASQGKISDDEFKKREQEIFKAKREGRLR